MNDLDLLERFRADLPPADPAALNRARARMFHTSVPASRSGWVWRLAPAAALATALGVAVVVVRADGLGPGPAPTVAGVPASDAARVFRLAADEARREPVLKARPDQFVYVESEVAWTGAAIKKGGQMSYLPPAEKRRRIWLSVDGTRTGLLRETAAKGGRPPTNGDVPIEGIQPAYVRGLPTESAKMRAWLYREDPGDRGPDTAAWSKIADTLREQYVPPASVAAIFEAAATIPGASEVKQVDLAGRPGIAVSRIDGGIRSDLIFDASTYRFLGERNQVVGADAKPFPKDTVIGWTAQLKVAIVDRAGQSPS